MLTIWRHLTYYYFHDYLKQVSEVKSEKSYEIDLDTVAVYHYAVLM